MRVYFACWTSYTYTILQMKKTSDPFSSKLDTVWRLREKRHATCKDGMFTLLNSWWINYHTVNAYVGGCLMPRPLLLRMRWIRHCHSTLSPYFTWNYLNNVSVLYMKLCHHTLSPYFTQNYVTILCRHTLHEIMSPYVCIWLHTLASQYSVVILYMKLSRYSVAIIYMKLGHNTLSPYFTWNYVTVLCRHTLHTIASQYSVAILFMKLRLSTMSPYFSWNYVTILCHHTLHKIMSQYSVAIFCMKLGHNTMSPYFTWNYVTVLCRHTLHEITQRHGSSS